MNLIVLNTRCKINIILTINRPMKHQNFMDNLTDQMMRENHKLKDELVEQRRKVRYYEDQIYEVIVQVDPNYQINQEFQVMLGQFGRVFSKQRTNFEQLKTSYQEVSQLNQQLKQQNLELIKEVQQRSALDQEIIQRWEKQKAQLVEKANVFKRELDQCMEKMTTLRKAYNDLRIEKLKIEEQKREEIESTCLQYHVEMMAIKTKAEKEHMKIQKILREEIETKNKTIKEMSAYVQELQKTRPESIQTTSAYMDMFNRLEQYNAMAQTINQLRNQNYQLRDDNKYLENYKSSLEVKCKESKATEHNLQSQLERTTIYLQEIEDKLMEKTKHALTLEKEKEEMDKYYSQRWVEEYKRVKNRLAKDMVKKIGEIQDNYNQKMAVMEARMYEAIGIKNQTIRKNQYLQSVFTNDQKAISDLNSDIEILSLKIAEFRQIVKQTDQLANEEKSTWKHKHHNEKTALINQLAKMENKLQEKSDDLENHKKFHIKSTNELNSQHEKDLKKQKEAHERQLRMTKEFHNKQNKRLMMQISLTSDEAQKTVKDIQENFKKELARKRKQFESQLGQRDLQSQRKHEKWVDKIQEMDNMYTQTKNRMEKNIYTLKEELDSLENKNQQLVNTRDQLKNNIERLRNEEKEMKKQMTELQVKIEKRDQNIKYLEETITKLQDQLQDSRKEVEVLIRMRSQWKNQLANLEMDYRDEFAQLKKMFDKQKNLLRQKIRQLEDLNKRKAVNRKQYEELKSLHEKQSTLKEEIHVREAENIILTQIKDYYETQLKQAEHHITKNELKQSNPLMNRKIKRKFRPRKESSSNKVLQMPRQDEWSDAKRYSINSYRKQFNYSLSKARLQEATNPSNSRNYRVKTSYAF